MFPWLGPKTISGLTQSRPALGPAGLSEPGTARLIPLPGLGILMPRRPQQWDRKGFPTTRTPVRRGRGPGRPLGSRLPCSEPGKQAARPLSGAGLAPQPGGAAACPAPGKASFRSRRRPTALCECAVGRAASLRTACRGRAGALPPTPPPPGSGSQREGTEP